MQRENISYSIDYTSYVRFTPIATANAEFRKGAMSALPPKADMCGAMSDVCYGPIADISRGECLLRSDLFEVGQFPFFVEQIFGLSIDQHELANGASILGHSIARQFAQQCLR
jgi:hypothetical protein